MKVLSGSISDFFDAIGGFFASDYVKNHTLLTIAILVFVFAIGGILMFLYMKYIWYKTTANENSELKKKLEESKALITELESKNNDLSNTLGEQERKIKNLEQENKRLSRKESFNQEFKEYQSGIEQNQTGKRIADIFNN